MREIYKVNDIYYIVEDFFANYCVLRNEVDDIEEIVFTGSLDACRDYCSKRNATKLNINM